MPAHKQTEFTNMEFLAELWTPQKTADFFGISRSTLNKWMKEGLMYFKIGHIVRFHKNDIDTFIKLKKKS